MHSRKKRIHPPTDEEIAAEKTRLEKIQKLHQMIFEEIQSGQLRDEGLGLTEKAMMISPDIYTFLNFRRRLVQWKLQECSEEERVKVFSQELDLLTKIIKESPKSYTLWYHRQWIIKQASNISQIMSRELGLCDLMLKKDNRNFHVWNYRSWVVLQEGNQSAQEELEFTKTMICRDFSNFSAWHYRTKIVKKLYPKEIPSDFIKSELSMLKNAYFTCPNDQSVWNYHRWLLLSQESIKIIGVSPRSYTLPPDQFLFAFSHCISSVSSSSINVSHGFEELEGSWQPVHTKPFSYLWKFTPTSQVKGPVEVRLSPVNETVVDFNGKTKLTSIKYKFVDDGTGFSFRTDGGDDDEILKAELVNIDELLEIEEDDVVQVLLRKAQICEELFYVNGEQGFVDIAIRCYEELIRKEPKHMRYYNEILRSFEALRTGRLVEGIQRFGKISAKVVGLE